MSPKRILYISTAKDRNDKCEWSGTVYYSLHALEEAGYVVDYVNALASNRQDLIDKLWAYYWCRIADRLKKNVRFDESFYTTRMMRKALAKIDYSDYDILFIPTDMCIVSALPSQVKQKIVHLVDAPVQSLFEYYTEFSNLTWQNRMEASILTKRAFRRADLIIASSDWCKVEAIKHCGIGADKIAVLEFGANIDRGDIPDVHHEYDPGKPLRIYWSGVNWVRKGGDVAFDCCRELVSRGYNVEFHITGMKELPTAMDGQPWIYNHGFLNKNNPEDYRRLIDIMSHQDIFLFPSRAECSSIAICEANAFGLPCFIYDTGGEANYVENGVNGYRLPLTSDGTDFADAIERVLIGGSYNRMSVAARNKYNKQLNWGCWSDRVKLLLTDLVCGC